MFSHQIIKNNHLLQRWTPVQSANTVFLCHCLSLNINEINTWTLKVDSETFINTQNMILALATNTRSADLHGFGDFLFSCSFNRGLKTPQTRYWPHEGHSNMIYIWFAVMCRAINDTEHPWLRALGVDIVLLLYAPYDAEETESLLRMGQNYTWNTSSLGVFSP